MPTRWNWQVLLSALSKHAYVITKLRGEIPKITTNPRYHQRRCLEAWHNNSPIGHYDVMTMVNYQKLICILLIDVIIGPWGCKYGSVFTTITTDEDTRLECHHPYICGPTQFQMAVKRLGTSQSKLHHSCFGNRQRWLIRERTSKINTVFSVLEEIFYPLWTTASRDLYKMEVCQFFYLGFLIFDTKIGLPSSSAASTTTRLLLSVNIVNTNHCQGVCIN